MTCLNDNLIQRFAQKRVSQDERAAVEDHAEQCAICRMVLSEAVMSTQEEMTDGNETNPRGKDPSHAVQVGQHIGRYEVVDVMGMGGGGVVYRAVDVQLQRAIALKVIRPDARQKGDTESQARLVREARAMAKLSHPNVVAIHDVGSFSDQVFLVMELVQGQNLSDWLRQGRRNQNEILDVFVQAGRGLAAAHASGLIHRDFKPDNVLVGDDGRVQVSDFGLALAEDGGEAPADHQSPPNLQSASPSGNPETHFAGTPGFMAPEQLAGGHTDARSDQFSFCVSLFMALFQRHPFGDNVAGETALDTMLPRIRTGSLVPLSDAIAADPKLVAILHKGLRGDPQKRHGSIEALLQDIAQWRSDSAHKRGARRLQQLAGGGLLLAASVLLGVFLWRDGSRQNIVPPVVEAVCGDAKVQGSEACDDGNDNDNDGCLQTCRFASCGDGIVRAHVEECDDGNQQEGDGCTASCLVCNQGQENFSWPVNGHCYTRHDAPTSWPEARRICRKAGGDLATYGSLVEANEVHAQLIDSTGAPAWIGITLDTHEGFSWVTHDTLSTARSLSADVYAAANSEERANPGPCGAQYAGTLTLHEGIKSPLYWRGIPCETPLASLCESATGFARPEDNHFYKVISHPATWAEAKAACESTGGHLVTFDDSTEREFVVGRIYGDIWIGARDVEGTFQWLGGAPVRAEQFAVGEPDRQGPPVLLPAVAGELNHLCAVVSHDRFIHDRSCARSYPFVCEID